jgi:outer membrane protein assembly factor BamE (lipoprotein component of BamABCDE complex)
MVYSNATFSGGKDMMRTRIVSTLLCGAVLALGGCAASQPAKPAARSAAPAAAPAAKAGAATGNSLSTVTVGMTKAQVRDAVGSPSGENSYASGKAWIPFYFGNDVRRTTWYYKGQGRVIFADGNQFGGGSSEVITVEIDPAEPGSN